MKGNQKGITLVALVITIIVLIILAAVSINLVLGENGVMQRAQTGAQEYNRKAAQESLELKIAGIDTDSFMKNGRSATLQELADGLSADNEIEYVELTSRVAATAPTVGDAEELYTKLKAYSYEFGVDKDLKISKVDGVAFANKNPENPPTSNLKVGDIVSYSPSGTYNWDNEYASSNQTGSITLSSAPGQNFEITEWRVLSVNGTTVEMVPKALTSGTVTLQGAQGYNNAVKLLNDACSSLYSDTSKGITARSINMDDIENIIIDKGGYDPTTYINKYNNNLHYGSQTGSAYTSNKYYPTIYAQEKDRVINGSIKTNGLGLSEQTSLISRTESSATDGYLQASSSIQPYQTYYYLDNTDFPNYLGTTYKDIISQKGTSLTYWVASRLVDTYSSGCNFNVRYVSSGCLGGDAMFDSIGNTYNLSRAMFPVVSLSSELISGNEVDGFSVN